jgi:hypothetical protein
MSLDELKREVEALGPRERHELSVFLVRLENTENPDYWREIRMRIDDRDPEHWVSLEELTKS